MSSERAKLVEKVLLRSRELSTETVMFHTAISQTRGLSAVESKVLDYVARFGPQTPKDLARHSGLAPASVTAMIDRLERKGIVNREPHPEDRRRVLIALDKEALASGVHLWDHLVKRMHELCERYSDDELRTVIGFIEAAAALTHESTAKLTGATDG
ncbi:MarR family winged helix-turn-helix transcriptional regulator [Amycolatopsis australiensis]|uniref:DNA-binding transcriptional regulator, MarR family n=1 Tax=Amycolatopsis australiensis TaxID=546364 RepID=A0A1K1Q6L5_9PSEU|nr:MarR family transcriptional regulator [Amycolatopsis australiensis]SFW55388.1 DNA-binding transcriptional regulator, MarR family [Amycolatopsis australiensis]